MTITLKEICKTYDKEPVLDHLSLSISKGQTTCLMGSSGCGKTTLANLLLGLLKPDKGSITGLDTSQIAAVFQEDRLCENLNSIKNIAIVCPKSVSKKQILTHLLEVGLTETDSMKPVSELSGGMKRRVALVRALITSNQMIILDEPFKGLDTTTKGQVIAYIKKYTQGKTLLIITHDKEDVALLDAQLIEL
ncbi:sulfate transporter [Sporanaerobium hydrogeniformans]|uniref:Sulfate transporter n=1 Tax=Sporanaerobium hydrogeniformans TaxID=3072179 RepID=A0AC61DC97_9FIRM|nr:ATP-binding cassette domain-containing protein [Sporanaerobium hydrogeniformans]PHV70860.1 sulfate transporter [Sporanaerobium hydrogeniformans]